MSDGSVNYMPPTSVKEVEALGWDWIDIIFFTGDAFVDHPSFGTAVLTRWLQKWGYRVAVDRRVVSAWIRFTQDHREALLKGSFRPHHPEMGYSWIEGESSQERVVAAYADDVCVKAGDADRQVFLVNATGKAGLLAELASEAAKVEYFNVFGEKVGERSSLSGIVRLAVPASGYAKVVWR